LKTAEKDNSRYKVILLKIFKHQKKYKMRCQTQLTNGCVVSIYICDLVGFRIQRKFRYND